VIYFTMLGGRQPVYNSNAVCPVCIITSQFVSEMESMGL